MEFQGYRRANGAAGIRNHVLVIPSVVCSQGAAEAITRNLKGTVYLANVFGCAQVGEDLEQTKRTLVGFGVNPNVFSVLVVGNGCETLPAKEMAEAILRSKKRVEFLNIQEVGGTKKTIAQGRKILKKMLAEAAVAYREPIQVGELVLATECGGSDYTSGLASNPSLGVASDLLVGEGGDGHPLRDDGVDRGRASSS
jgi:altronate dehydratase large subunit